MKGCSMLRQVFAAISVFALAAAAAAAPTFSLVEVDNHIYGHPTIYDLAIDVWEFNNAGYLTYDLVMDVGAETWTTTYSLATLTGGTFFNHPLGATNEMAPNPATFAAYAVLPFDTFYTGMNDFPNAMSYGDASAAPGSPIQNGDAVREMEYYDYPELDNTGEFITARFTILPTSDVWSLTVEGTTTTIEGGADAEPFSMTYEVPEPTSLALLVIGGLALIRRR